MDPSLKPDPKRKGSYYRRIEDIDRALKKMGADRLPKVVQFATYYFACEKLARGIVGIHSQCSANDAYQHRKYLRLNDIRLAAKALTLSISIDDLNWLFSDFSEKDLLREYNTQYNSSARVLRNTLGHDFGPSNIDLVLHHVDFLIPKMSNFLACAGQVLAYQKANFSGIP